MSVRRREDGVVVLEGACSVEDAEPLLQALLGSANATCDWMRCDHVHTAVAQVLLMVAPTMVGPCGDAWMDQWMAPEIERRARAL